MNTFEINYDFGSTNQEAIINAIDSLNAGNNTRIMLLYNAGGNAQLAIDLTASMLSSSAQTIEIVLAGYVCSAAAFVVMGATLFNQGNIELLMEQPVSLMFHRPRIFSNETGIPYFDLHSTVNHDFDKVMHGWINLNKVNFYNQDAYYTNHEYVTILN